LLKLSPQFRDGRANFGSRGVLPSVEFSGPVERRGQHDVERVSVARAFASS
jgi:hypothetical protein